MTFLGIELGSTRIKSVLIDEAHQVIATGVHTWENKLEHGVWTYALEDIHAGLRASVGDLCQATTRVSELGGIGISAMMHGYLALDAADQLLVPFRTWRNTSTETAAETLTKVLNFNIPQRWSVAHLYQAALDHEPHLKHLAHITTLAGYVHALLTGQRVLGIGDASGMFPVLFQNAQEYHPKFSEKEQDDRPEFLQNEQESHSESSQNAHEYHPELLKKFNKLIQEYDLPALETLLPRILPVGAFAGVLTETGAALLDPEGRIPVGVPLCPPEGDAGTGMVATNSIRPGTGNVSAGTSVFAMAVLERELTRVYPEIDLVATPSGDPVAMVHCNNCTAEIDAWAGVFSAFLARAGVPSGSVNAYELLYTAALEPSTGSVLSYNTLSGEPVLGLSSGVPLLLRTPEKPFTFPELCRALVCSAVAALHIGMKLLTEQEGVRLDSLQGHGGFFKVSQVGQQLLAGALNVPATVMETAGEGGAWGMALLAAYASQANLATVSFFDWLDQVFSHTERTTLAPLPEDIAYFETYAARFQAGVPIVAQATKLLSGNNF